MTLTGETANGRKSRNKIRKKRSTEKKADSGKFYATAFEGVQNKIKGKMLLLVLKNLGDTMIEMGKRARISGIRRELVKGKNNLQR